MACVPLLTLWWRQCHILHSKAGKILTLQKCFSYCLLPIHSEVLAEPIGYSFKESRMSPISALHHSMYIMFQKHMSSECAAVLNYSHSEMYHKISEFPMLDSFAAWKFMRTGDTKVVDLWSDMISLYSWTVYLSNCRIGCYLTINISLPYICSTSGTWLQGRIYPC